MYKALDLRTFEEIILLQRYWQERVSELRVMDRDGLLGCPGCKQPVRVRAGKNRRWHFAHKHLKNCPLARQSPALLESRGVLYDWLIEQYGEERVKIEREFPGLPRPVDAWITLDEREIGYWIFDTRYSPNLREILLENESLSGAHMNWLFTIDMMRSVPETPNWLYLTTTERDFMRASVLDLSAEATGGAPGKSLHYLDYKQGLIITFRRLQLQHKPQRFSARRIDNLLKEVHAIKQSGEFLHPGEEKLLSKYLLRAEAAQLRLKKHYDLMSARGSRIVGSDSEVSRTVPGFFSSLRDETLEYPAQRQPFAREGTCIHCGKKTTDWLTYDAGSGECICRECQSA